MRLWTATVLRAPISILLAGLSLPVAFGQQNPVDALGQLSLEELLNTRVISVSKKEQTLSEAGAAVYVISQEEIRQSGMTNLPDLLRLAPGVDVARIDANTWAVSIRGFNSRYSDKTLVLVDGRSVYTPGFSGVYWDQLAVPLEDIDRIEVIRGPGGTVWGANAVNGVINIITKKAGDTPGGTLVSGGGSEEYGQGLVQYGGKLPGKGGYRVYGSYDNIGPGIAAKGAAASDDWSRVSGGFQGDWAPTDWDKFTASGQLLQNREGQTITTLRSESFAEGLHVFNDQVRVAAGNLLGRWEHTLADGSEAAVQVYYDRFNRFDQAENIVNTLDTEGQYEFHAGSRHDLMAGIGYRFINQSYLKGYEAAFLPGHRDDYLTSAFLQDEITLHRTVALTIGSKLEHNSYTGFECEPSVQLVWTPNNRNMMWLSAAQAVREPSWIDVGAVIYTGTVPIPGVGIGLLEVLGNPKIKPETLRDFEAGWRRTMGHRLSMDVSFFRSYYANLITYEPQTPVFAMRPAPPHLLIPIGEANLAAAHTYGGEVSITYRVHKRWRISPSYSFLQMHIRRDASSADSRVEAGNHVSPKHQFQVHSNWNVTRRLEWDSSLYSSSPLLDASFFGSDGGPATLAVRGVVRVDTRLAWRASESVELSIAGLNLLTPHHFEFANGYQVNPTQVGRSANASVIWRF